LKSSTKRASKPMTSIPAIILQHADILSRRVSASLQIILDLARNRSIGGLGGIAVHGVYLDLTTAAFYLVEKLDCLHAFELRECIDTVGDYGRADTRVAIQARSRGIGANREIRSVERGGAGVGEVATFRNVNGVVFALLLGEAFDFLQGTEQLIFLPYMPIWQRATSTRVPS
jgi:hypothetical protein